MRNSSAAPGLDRVRIGFPIVWIVLVLVAIAAIWLGVAGHLAAVYADDTKDAERETANLARGFGEHISRTIEGVDQIMLLLRAAYAHNPAMPDLPRWAPAELFSHGLTLQITLVDTQGIVISSNLGPVTGRVDLSDRAHIRAQLDSDADRLFISEPVLGRVSRKWSIQFTRKLLDAEGGLAGVIVVSLSPGYLSRFYESIEIGQGTILLAGSDGVVRARAPEGDAHIGQALPPATMALLHAGPVAGTFRAVDPQDGVDRIHAYRWLAGQPLVVIVAEAAEDIFSGYAAERAAYVTIGILLTAMVVLVAGVAAVQRGRVLRSRAELAATLENISQGILMIDAHHRVPVLNRRAAELLDLPAELARPGIGFEDILAWQTTAGQLPDPATRRRESHPVAQRGGQEQSPYERTRPDGTVIEVRTQPLADGGAVRTYTDITARKRGEAALAAARDAAEAGVRARTEFLAMMSHEIRTPMNGVLGMANLLLETGLDGEQRGHVETLRAAAEDLLRIINDILDFSKLEADRMEFEHIPFAIAEAVEGVMSLMRLRATKQGIALRVELDPRLPPRVLGDPGRLRQVLLNLVSNGIKFTPAGHVTVAASLIGIEEGIARVGFRVTDSGIGIPTDALGRLFQSFAQLDSSISRRFGGTGLGLAICRRLVERMGGEIGADSAPGRGSVFRFTVRLAVATGPAAQPPEEDGAARPAARSTLRILLAEDNPTNQIVATAQLKRLGHEVDIATDGEQAVRAVQARPYDLVLMDMMMPGMDGLAATRAIRALPGGEAGLPIVALTANAFREDEQACLAAGMDAFLPKPVPVDALRHVLERAMAGTLRPIAAPAP